MKVRYLVYTLIILGVGALVYYRIAENKKQKEAMQGSGKGGPQQAMVVNGVVVAPQPFSNTLQLSGSIEANEQVQVSSEVSGVVDKIYFTEGTMVKEGQVLVHINDVELRAQAVGAKTRQNLAAENERRAKLLLEKEAISQEEYDIASADYKTALAQTQLINAQIGKASIRAPFSGVIGLRNISPGTYVSPTTLITTLVNSSKVKITFSVPEKYAAQVKNNSKIRFTVAGDATGYTATVYALEPAVEVSTRTLRVRAIADNPKGNLLPGTFANVKLQIGKADDAFLVPTEAIVPVQDGKKVFISENGKAKEVMIQTGTRTDANIQVIDGLKPGDTVLTTGVLTLKNEAPVKVTVTPKK
ncbi:cation transporter [Flavobacterium akiainvivens]|uniref:Cation transporter n=1 Tax=Flavobacterium akiainvivens TaxID=1202724 RepID=A0A0N0RR24_9FLAO|nr:efflux RND transporter periplasmic adaptor subunit [Flavobacterium akiainvivens]KOS07749.1 cation transporter [Flavobacterium akiainvivens]SFQ25564.1 membrane fusion protein, multidrug efflux system [Flavobacterium akiainvivens]